MEGRLALARADLIRDGTGSVDGGRLREAGDAIDQALKLDRENGLAWLAMGRVQRLLGDFQAASDSLTRAGRLLEEHLPALCAESALLALENGDDIEAERLTDAADIRGEGALIAYVRGNIAARRGGSMTPSRGTTRPSRSTPPTCGPGSTDARPTLEATFLSARLRTPNASWCRRQTLACTPATCGIQDGFDALERSR